MVIGLRMVATGLPSLVIMWGVFMENLAGWKQPKTELEGETWCF
jgi:hypothetical protein